MTAQRFVFGPIEEVVRSHLIRQEMPPFVPDPADLGFIAGREASVHEMLFFQLLTMMADPPPHPAYRIYIAFSKKIEKAKSLGRWVDIG